MGYLVSAAFHENEGEAELATTYAREAFARARRVGEVWGQAMSAQLLAQLSSQVGEPGDAVAWARQSIALLAEVHADGDVQQLWGILAVNEIAAGNVDEGRKILGELSGDVLGRGSGDLVDAAAEVSIMRAAGLAEADLADGHVDAGLARYREAVGLLTGSDRQMSPWSLMIGAAMVCAHAQHDPAAHRDVIAAQVRRLRHQVLARYRWSSAYADLPVTGTVLLGVAVGLSATPGHPGREPERSRVALELLALAERFHARQDYPALLWQPHVDAARRRHGAEAVDAARARVEAMERTDLMPYAIDLLGSAAIVE